MSEQSVRATHLADKGGHFYRADFQVHTPRDTQWDGGRPAFADRDSWARTFVAAAREKGVDAVAISDHHDFVFFPYIKKAAAAEVGADGSEVPAAQRLVVFPALELTFSVPCQAILMLDADFPEDRLDDILKALYFDPVDASLDTLPQTDVLQDSGDINDIHAKLDKNDWLQGRYIILPNVTPSGHKTLLRTSFQAKYRDMVAVGGYLDGSIAELDKQRNAGEKRILAGGDSNWGSKRLALFQTSDARKADFSTLGAHTSWVKWATPTAEALRQACLAQESRLAQSEPAMPNVWISRVVVSQSKFMGRVDVALNPQYTALIGGRGTGKSTILDYLRWTLCDQPAQATADDEVVDPRVRQRRLIEATLKPLEGHIEVHCAINGIAHVVRRYAADGAVHLKVGDAEYEKVREGAIQSLLPIQAYSQKQLSSVAIRVDELLRFVTSPIQRDLEEIDRKQQEVTGRLRENYGTLQRHRDLTAEIQRSELRIRSLAEQAQALRDGLSGLSDEDRTALDGKSAHDRARTSQATWDQHLDTTRSDLVEMRARINGSLEKLVRPEGTPAELDAEVGALFDAAVATLSSLRASLSLLVDEFGQALGDGGAVGLSSTALTSELEAYEQAYAAVKARSSAHEAELAELAKLEEQQKTAGDLAQKQRKERDALGKPGDRHKELRHELTDARKERTAALEVQCDGLSTSSDGLIRATLSASRGFDSAQAKFKALVTGSNVRTSRIEGVFEELAKESDPAATWELVLNELESLMLLEPDADVKSERTPTLSRLGLPVGDQKKLAPTLTPDGWLDLSLIDLADFPEFKYRAKEDEYIAFDSASAGQQASALLATLLAQGGTPLIIDQPEDDLDSDSVQAIVNKIWTAKSTRQLIFSSHNANLVVNGDADLVLVCAYVNAGDQSAGHIKEQGAIDVAAVRDEITSVMEGGEKAFRLRKEKYGF
jgi:chromosome segregation protein